MDIVKDDLTLQEEEYLDPTPDRIVDQKVVSFIADWVISRLDGNRILELGVGDQLWTPKLVARFPDVTSVDGSPRLLEAMRRRLGPGAKWTPACSYFEEYEPERPFDTALSTYVLEHVPDPGLIIRRVRSWLVDGGHLAVVVPHALSLHRRLARKMGLIATEQELGETDRRMGHRRIFTHDEMRQLMIDSGFEIVEERGLFTKALPNGMLTHCSDEQLRGLVELGVELPIEYSAAIYFKGRKPAS